MNQLSAKLNHVLNINSKNEIVYFNELFCKRVFALIYMLCI